MSALVLLAALAATAPVRDPFWPVGYKGTLRVISAEPRTAQAAESPRAEDRVAEFEAKAQWEDRAAAARLALEMDRRWTAAAKSLKFGGVIQMQQGCSAVLINGRARSEGDLVRTDYEGTRFVWRVARGESERKLKLDRVKAVSLSELKGRK